MRIPRWFFANAILLISLFIFLGPTPFSQAETIELVTYFPSGSGTGRNPQLRSLRVGSGYANSAIPEAGTALIQDYLGIGIPAPSGLPLGILELEVRGAAAQDDVVLFGPGAGGTLQVASNVRDDDLVTGVELQLASPMNSSSPPCQLRIERIGTSPSLVAIEARENYGFLGTQAADPLRLAANNQRGILVEAAGRVGIGPTVGALNYPLEVASNDAALAEFTCTNAASTYSGVAIDSWPFGLMGPTPQDPVLVFQGRGTNRWTIGNDEGDSDKFKFRAGAPPLIAGAGAAAWTVQTDGWVGIGTTAPQAALDVFSGALLVPRNAADPAGPVNGMIYYHTANGFQFYENGTWRGLPNTGVLPRDWTYTGNGSAITYVDVALGAQPRQLEIWKEVISDSTPSVANNSAKWEKCPGMVGEEALITADHSAVSNIAELAETAVRLHATAGVELTATGFRVRGNQNYQPNQNGRSYRYVAYF